MLADLGRIRGFGSFGLSILVFKEQGWPEADFQN